MPVGLYTIKSWHASVKLSEPLHGLFMFYRYVNPSDDLNAIQRILAPHIDLMPFYYNFVTILKPFRYYRGNFPKISNFSFKNAKNHPGSRKNSGFRVIVAIVAGIVDSRLGFRVDSRRVAQVTLSDVICVIVVGLLLVGSQHIFGFVEVSKIVLT